MARPSTPLAAPALAASLATLIAPQLIVAQPLRAATVGCAALQPDRHHALGETIGLIYGRDVPPRQVRQAIALWQECSGYASSFPAFVTGVRGTRTLRVRFELSSGSPRCGGFSGTEIVVYAWAMENGRQVYCGPPALNLAHELGHALGLEDVPPACADRIMAPVDPGRPLARAVRADECRIAESYWRTGFEVAATAAVEAVSAEPLGRRRAAGAAATPDRTRW